MKMVISKLVLLGTLSLILTSCGTSKSVLALMDSYDYGIKKVHIEQKNSSYDNLVSDFYESLKSDREIYSEELAKDTMLHMRKGPCLGRCPVYSITIYNNGKVKYDGVTNIEMAGIFESKLEGDQQARAQKLIDAIELPRMYSRYPRGVDMATDVARTKMVISDGIIKFPTVISYGQPDELKDIEQYLVQLIKDLSWVQI